ncbi:MAG TPA: phosphatidylglycerophosphatase A [Candidatus Eisenbacteria bacterium]|nr:phosphatidylglycerophosphatase A [Candidatus Eisenbacteria bacterium]
MRTLVIVLATAGGAGYAPVAPGTVGALVALPLVPWIAALRAQSWSLATGLVLVIVVVAIWVAGRAEAIFGQVDHSRIVVDEVAGIAAAALFVPATWVAAGIVFVVFRVFDVVKPFPAGAIDRGVHGGLGVVGDDVVAGVYAGVVTRVLLEVL